MFFWESTGSRKPSRYPEPFFPKNITHQGPRKIKSSWSHCCLCCFSSTKIPLKYSCFSSTKISLKCGCLVKIISLIFSASLWTEIHDLSHSSNHFWPIYFFKSRYFSTILVSALSLLPVDPAMHLSLLIEGYVCKWFQDCDPLDKALLGHPHGEESWVSGEVIKFLRGRLEPEPGWWGNSNHCLAQVSPISSKMVVRIGGTTGKVKYFASSFTALPSESCCVKLGKLACQSWQ